MRCGAMGVEALSQLYENIVVNNFREKQKNGSIIAHKLCI